MTDGIAAVVAKLAKVPDRVRTFGIDEAAARTDYQIAPDLLDRLRGAGLPYRTAAGSPTFDGNDLINVALHLDFGSRPRKVLGWWARELERSYGDVHTYEVEYFAGCPDPRRCRGCRFSLLRPDQPRLQVDLAPAGPAVLYRHRFPLARSWPDLPDTLVELIDDFSGIEYLQLPDPLCWDTEFVRRYGIGDCAAYGKILVSEGRARGLTTRFCFGRSLTPPFSAAHYWPEFLISGVWVPLDSLLVGALTDWGVLSPERWGRTSSLGAIMARLANRPRPLAMHNGSLLPVQVRVHHGAS
ncbi:hypothetical protein GXW83_23860 [Streptacidiphilus sp. PB12-B1b]|uniref:transglutaminase domain-containing protein n=1 Tax=Streptacidiphilus sp. PB12-B1b TaxID=2705012 RepID=UPI0015FC54F6|nr:transglutaminase domain-containing protein [Streptacidiphilus sp. PB12-B1b]QMU78288.1 hypothetical protein GXW83_23860 [Streptacidiphilus sp. PB12-B1b]